MIKLIYNDLIDKYYEYYCTVYHTFIYEAIENTIKDLNIKDSYDIDAIHNHIIENYI